VITVHAGVDREWINPPRGGESDDKRIVYQAAPGEKVEVKGSEVVKGWVKVQDMSEGGAYVHNLMTGKMDNWYDMERLIPYMESHSTALAGSTVTQGGDNRYFNNIFVGQGLPCDLPKQISDPRTSIKGFGLWVFDARNFLMQTGGNVYYNGARPYAKEVAPLTLKAFDPKPVITEKKGGVYLQITFGKALEQAATGMVTTDLLGKAKVPGLTYENPDGTPVKIDTDYFGRKRDPVAPSAGPFENPGAGSFSLKVQ
jgi:hypothetical protein